MIGKGPLKNPSGNGLELDKLEVPARAMPETVRQPTADSERKPTPSPGTGSSGKKHLRLTLTVVIVTLALLAVIATYMKKQNLRVSFLSLKKSSFSDSYLRVGPVTATIQTDEVIRLSLEIGCANDSVKEKLAEKDSRIRDKIVSVLTEPDTKTFLQNHQYEAVKAKIKNGLEQIYGESIGEVYFAELLTY